MWVRVLRLQELVEVSEAFLCEVSERMKQEPLRPQSRKEEGEVDLRQGRCIVITDLTLLPPADGGSSAPTICVEIKASQASADSSCLLPVVGAGRRVLAAWSTNFPLYHFAAPFLLCAPTSISCCSPSAGSWQPPSISQPTTAPSRPPTRGIRCTRR